jgi:hypothetical protein
MVAQLDDHSEDYECSVQTVDGWISAIGSLALTQEQ